MPSLSQFKTMLIIAVPLSATFLAQKCMTLIDNIMLGWIGPEALAAGALSGAVFITAMVFGMGLLSAVGVSIARARGAEDENDIKISLFNGIYLALFASIPAVASLWFAPHLLILLGEDPAIVAKSALLLHAMCWGLPIYFIFLTFREFVSAFAKTKIVMFTTISSFPLVFFANYILIYGKFGLPALGIAGIGYANALVMWYLALCLFVYCRKKSLLRIHLPYKFHLPEWNKISDLLTIGLPSGLLFVLESGMFLAAALFMGYFGADALAAHVIALQCVNIVYSIPVGMAMATAIQVGHAAGAKNYSQAKDVIWLNIISGVIVCGCMATAFIFSSNLLADIFLDETASSFIALDNLAGTFIFTAAFFQCFDGLQSIANGALRGLKDTFFPMLISIACYWIVGIGSSYLLAFHTPLNERGIWWGLTLGIFSVSIILLWRLINRLKAPANNYHTVSNT